MINPSFQSYQFLYFLFHFYSSPAHLGILAITLTSPFVYLASVTALFKVSQICLLPWPLHQLI